MAVEQFRFEQIPPSEDALRRRFADVMGARLCRTIDSIELGADSATGSDRVVWVTSQDYVALAYARKVCAELGGRRVGVDGEAREPELKAWVQTPWHEYDWVSRLRIRFGRT